ncbi:hypothetical protein PENTCL1PPCAC_9825, partial [Pristionchus entomophagus]
SLAALPLELVSHVASFLDGIDRLNVRAVCKHLRDAIAASDFEVDTIILNSADDKKKEVGNLRNRLNSGLTYIRRAFSGSKQLKTQGYLLIHFGSSLHFRTSVFVEDVEGVISTRQKLFHKIRAQHLRLELIDFATFPIKKIEELLGACEFDQISMSTRSGTLEPSVLAFMHRYSHKRLTLEMHDRILDMPTLLALPQLHFLTVAWGQLEFPKSPNWNKEKHALPERDLLELVKQRHASIFLPVNMENERDLLEILMVVSASDIAQHVTLKVFLPLLRRFLSLVDCEIINGEVDDINQIRPSEFVFKSHQYMPLITHGNAQMSILKCSASHLAYGSVRYYQIGITNPIDHVLLSSYWC